jgi:DUF4097 and DUF4098 domain-containing protein YvlB
MHRNRLAYLALMLGAAALTTLPSGLSAQRDDDDWMSNCDRSSGRRGREPYCEVRVSGYKARAGVVTVDPGDNGGVEIRGWDKDSVEIHARIQVNNRSDADSKDVAGQIKVTTQGNAIGANGPDTPRSESWSVSFVVYLPRKTDLTLDTYNGPIGVEDINGTLRLTAQNGPISLRHVSGDVRAKTQNGPVSVRLDGVRWDGPGLDVSSQNGPVDLRVPRDYNADLEFGTVNGPMSVGFPVSVTLDGRMTKRITTKLGTGGATIRAVTTNGPFTLARAESSSER